MFMKALAASIGHIILVTAGGAVVAQAFLPEMPWFVHLSMGYLVAVVVRAGR